MAKTCNGGYCNYKTSLGSVNPECTYNGYCDYQTPKDSRRRTSNYPDPIMPYLVTEETCPYCHLLLTKCLGHTTCKGDSNG